MDGNGHLQPILEKTSVSNSVFSANSIDGSFEIADLNPNEGMAPRRSRVEGRRWLETICLQSTCSNCSN
jgi:hypothetical protein